ncbi:ClpP/crotonase-like domain-containing protein [Podospora didyma]|uniref:3-hydroxyisobutyryl-CoA hydrolase n=1 Tax=Podospora didyma TaxID=330526 RepID=A0AAE0KL80_9PEZI|nr:ClpP/crotonase-like domain-containing protein [Podospora didyma]
MPLKAKIMSQQLARQKSTSASKAAENDAEDVLFNSNYGLRSIELNRPSKLNALNGSMISKITPRLLEWAKSDMANVIVMKGAGPKAFCAGGDVATLALWNKNGQQQKSIDYFSKEYQLDHLIATYQKPYIAFMDGITMGGGVGLSVHAPIRIATERTVFAMPETTIGFFPDVGASFFLPRMAGEAGTYLALTSERLSGVNVFYTGLATHYLHSSSLPQLESRLAELRFKDYDDMPSRLAVINATIEEYCTGLPYDEPMFLAGEIRNAIDRCFRHDTVHEILAALEAEQAQKQQDPQVQAWAKHTIDVLHQRSPTSVHVALRQMRLGPKWSISETFKREHQIAAKFMKGQEFTRGVTSKLIDRSKGPVQWEPRTLEDILPEENISEDFFKVDEKLPKLELLSRTDYVEYPYSREFGLPTEKDVMEKVSLGLSTPDEVLQHFLEEKRNKQGVLEVVSEILARKVAEDKQGTAVWVDHLEQPTTTA